MSAPAAAVVERLAVLLEAGIPPLAAWGYLDDGDAVRAARAVETADEVPDALLAATARAADASAWACLAAVWTVAVRVGAPLAPTLARLADVLHELEEGAREVDTALAGPVATGRLVLALPPLGLGLGLLLGVDLAAVFTGIPGLACAAIGVALLVAGRRWTRRLVAAARDLDPTPGLEAELLAVAVTGGLAIDPARALVAEAIAASGVRAERAELRRAGRIEHGVSTQFGPLGDPAIDETLAFAARAGVPVAALLRSTAREARRDARGRARRRAAELGTRLLLPLGVCILPSFIALGVAPFLLGMLASTSLGPA